MRIHSKYFYAQELYYLVNENKSNNYYLVTKLTNYKLRPTFISNSVLLVPLNFNGLNYVIRFAITLFKVTHLNVQKNTS